MVPQAMQGAVGQADQLRDRLEVGLRSLEVEASDSQQRQLLDFVTLLSKWNAVYNLTSIRDPIDMLAIHLLDALSIVGLVDRLGGTVLLDVGSGAGLPAIPIAIARPRLAVHSVDAVAKKIGFQLQAKASLKLANLHPRHARIEAMLSAPMPIVVSRAFADIATMLTAIDHVADGNTRVIAMKGRKPFEELASLPPAWHVEQIESIDVPFLGAERCAVVLARVPEQAPG